MNVHDHIIEAAEACRIYREHVNAVGDFFGVATPDINCDFVTELLDRRWRIDDDQLVVELIGSFTRVAGPFRKDNMVAYVCTVRDFWEDLVRHDGLYIFDEAKEVK